MTSTTPLRTYTHVSQLGGKRLSVSTGMVEATADHADLLQGFAWWCVWQEWRIRAALGSLPQYMTVLVAVEYPPPTLWRKGEEENT